MKRLAVVAGIANERTLDMRNRFWSAAETRAVDDQAFDME